MKIALIKDFIMNGPEDGWSGIRYYTIGAMRKQGIDIDYVDGLKETYPLSLTIKSAVLNRLLGVHFTKRFDPSASRTYARRIERRLAAMNKPDALFHCSYDAVPVAYLKPGLPLICWSDAPYGYTLRSPYYAVKGFSGRSLRDGMALEKRMLARASLCIYASEWAAQVAAADHPESAEKIRAIPYGANMEPGLSAARIEDLIRRRSESEVCRLLFVGQFWERKGGAIAVEACAELNRRGIRAELAVVGSVPPPPVPAFVKVYARLSKSDAGQFQILKELYESANFFVMPTRAECYGIVLCEASAYGIPSAVTRVGGTSEPIRDGVNGKLFDVSDGPALYADYFESLFRNPARYRETAAASYREYETRLNWDAAGLRFRRLLEEVLS